MLTQAELEATEWAKEFKADAPASYKEALRYALDPSLSVLVCHHTDAEESTWASRDLWALAVVLDGEESDFWLDAKPTKKEAIALCRRMGWKIEGAAK